MKICKIKKVETPSRGTEQSAGIDFYIPRFTESFLRDFQDKNVGAVNLDGESIRVLPGELLNIPSGIIVEMPKDCVLIAFNKSGISSKFGLSVLACVVDSDYQGEVHLSIVNTSNHIVDIYSGQKLVQFILFKLPYCPIIEVEIKDIHINETKRGKNGFGSTGI